MAELEKEQLENEEEIDIVDDINAWKKSHVPKADYDKLKEQNKKLAKSLMNGSDPEQGKAPEKPNIDELKKQLVGARSNMEKWQALCDLRDARLELTGQDNFDIKGENPDDAQLVYDGMRYCLEVADGRPEVFNATLDRIMEESIGPRPKR